MPDIKNQFNQSTFNDAKFFSEGKPIPKFLTPAAAAVPRSFLGREKELADIRNLLTRQNTLALVNAEGGMGKTTLAARYWQQFESQYQHLAWLFCENGILNAMRDQLPNALGLVEALNPLADNPDKQVQVIKTAMANLPKDCLLVLDNANEPDHIRGFQQVMTGLGWHVLITSRCSKVLTDANAEYKITGLPPDQAKTLFKSNHDEKTPEFETLLERFLLAVEYNTLCIEVFSKNLREGTAWGLSLAALLENLEKNGLFLGDESFEIQTEWASSVKKETVKSTDQVIAALYDVADLQQKHTDLHELLCTFALLPAENHPPTVLGILLAPDDKPGLKRSLDHLVKKGWLSSDSATYRISPVLQKILLQRNAERRWVLGELVVQRLQTVFEAEGFHPKNIATAGPFAELVFGIVDNLEAANEDLAILFDRLWMYQTATGNLAKAMDTAERMKFLCEKFEFKNSLAISYEKLGSTHSALGNLNKALGFYEERSRLGKELYEAYPQNVSFKNGLAISYSKLGETHSALGNLNKALGFYEERSRLGKELYEAYPQNVSFKNGLAISYCKLGETHSALGNLNKVLGFYEQSNQLEKELYEAYPQNVSFKNGLAISYEKLGETHSAVGNLNKALGFFQQFNDLIKALHEANSQNVGFKNGLAISYSKLGETHSALGNLNKALGFYEERSRLGKELYEAYPQNVSFKNGLAISYQYLGITHSALGNLNKALGFYEQDIELSKELYETYPQNVSLKNGLAISYYKLGQLYEKKEDFHKAFECYEQDLKFTKMVYETSPSNAQFRAYLKISYNQMGNIAQKLGKTALSEEYFALEKSMD
ncbi:MAG: tetratricopeptide repeat protein [Saprospiraceae bacterium]